MARREEIEQRSEALLLPITSELGLELVDVEYVKEGGSYYLRAYIDKDGGVTIDDCEEVSRAFNPILDAEDFISESYTMEVSSPGLTRPLKKEKDYARSIGKQIEIHCYKAIDGEKVFVGELLSYDDKTLTIQTEEGERSFDRSALSKVSLAFVF